MNQYNRLISWGPGVAGLIGVARLLRPRGMGATRYDCCFSFCEVDTLFGALLLLRGGVDSESCSFCDVDTLFGPLLLLRRGVGATSCSFCDVDTLLLRGVDDTISCCCCCCCIILYKPRSNGL